MNEQETLAKLLGFRYLEKLPEPAPPRELIRGEFGRIVGSWGRQHLSVPILETENEIVVATSDPLNVEALDELRMCFELPIAIVVTTEDQVTKAINSIRTNLMSDRSSELSNEEQNDGVEFQDHLKIDVTDAEDDDAPIIRYVNSIVFKASSERASDIHIEPFENNLKVRFRVDGVLKDVAEEEKSFQAAIISRIKVMAGLNIAEKRLPQDGRIGLKVAGNDVDLRVSTVPTQFGERIVMRLLDKQATILDLEQLGFSNRNLESLNSIIKRPHGIILVTGPTGSGKTTTLYSCLTKINTPQLNILTVEDPIEYQLDGIGQMQVNTKIDFTFASGLRSILRQDPDVVMLGEIRDKETADIAIQASLTGHLVLSTLHTNDASSSINRLIDIGIEPFLVSSSIIGIMAQRLVRTLCSSCKQPYQISDEELVELGINPSSVSERNAFRPDGCEACQHTGYRGRAGIHELLMFNEDIRSLILRQADSSAIKDVGVKQGMRTLRMDGAIKVLKGVTSVEEVLRVTIEDSA